MKKTMESAVQDLGLKSLRIRPNYFRAAGREGIDGTEHGNCQCWG